MPCVVGFTANALATRSRSTSVQADTLLHGGFVRGERTGRGMRRSGEGLWRRKSRRNCGKRCARPSASGRERRGWRRWDRGTGWQRQPTHGLPAGVTVAWLKLCQRRSNLRLRSCRVCHVPMPVPLLERGVGRGRQRLQRGPTSRSARRGVPRGSTEGCDLLHCGSAERLYLRCVSLSRPGEWLGHLPMRRQHLEAGPQHGRVVPFPAGSWNACAARRRRRNRREDRCMDRDFGRQRRCRRLVLSRRRSGHCYGSRTTREAKVRGSSRRRRREWRRPEPSRCR